MTALRPAAGAAIARCRRCGSVSTGGPPATGPAYGRDYYGRWYLATEPDRRAFLDRLLVRLPLPAGALVVDVGCGPGFALDAASRRAWRAVGIDTSPAALEVAAGRGRSVARAAAEALPVGPGTADAVLLLDVVAHVDDPRAAVGAAVAALRPGGATLVKTPRRPPWLYRAGGRMPARVARTLLHLPHQRHLFTRRGLAALLVGAGLTGVEVEASADSIPVRRRLRAGVKAAVAALLDAAAGALAGSESLVATGRRPDT